MADKQYAHCTKKTTVAIPCDHCVNVIYCSTFCRNKAWNDYHQIECPILEILLDLELPTSIHLGMKVTLKAIQEAGRVVELKEMVEKMDSVTDPRVKGFTGNVLDCTKYACTHSLTSHGEKHMIGDNFYMSLITTFIIYYLAAQTEIFGQKCNKDLGIFNKNPLMIFLGGVMIRNCDIVQVTSMRNVTTESLDLLVAPFTGLCNHSCNPNIISLGENKTVAFAVQPIKAGEQLFVNYMDLHYRRVPKAQRQKLLKRDYHFSCDCVACINNWPMLDQLPVATEIPGISDETQTLLLNAISCFWLRAGVVMMSGNMMNAKDALVELLEVLYEHACPCHNIMTYEEYLIKIYAGCIDPF